MKKITLACTLLIALMASAFAGPVDSTYAKKMANNFWQANIAPMRGEQNEPQFRNLAPQMALNHLYIWQNASGEGFVIMSADDCALPILGYSENGHIDVNQMPSNFAYWLQGFDSEIEDAVSQNIAQDETTAAEWTAIAHGQVMAPKSPTAVNPLLSTYWDQGSPYNAMCPGSSWNRCPTGCVATAMAQVMKYWAYPPKGCGSHSYVCDNYGTLSANFGNTTYNWSSMPNYCSSSNTHVATLMFHCGVATEMNYTTSGSGAQVLDYGYGYASAETAFHNFFGYKNTLNGQQKAAFTDSEWQNMLKTELNAGRPVLYSGYGPDAEDGGHAFVCDGYNSSNYFHFNWGWSGSNDGYFLLTSLNPGSGGWGGGSYNFTYGQLALFGVEPPALVLNAAFGLTPNSTTIQHGSTLSVSVNYKNISTSSFSGSIRLVLLKGNTVAQVIGTEASASLVANNIGTKNVSSLITVMPGEYRLALQYKPNGTNDWINAGIGNGTNLLNVTVVLNPDMYENNNTAGTAYVFTPTFSNNQTTVSTTGSNFHEGDQYDYYKIDLPSGYRYAVNIRLHDAADSGNGQLYTNDAIMKISKNGGSWGAAIDTIADAFVLDDGGPLVYKVYPKSSNNNPMGTYLITTQITRTSTNGVENDTENDIVLYPNPTTGACTLRNAQPGSEMQVFDAFGKLLFSRKIDGTSTIDLSNYAKGIYMVKVINAQGENFVQKVVKE